MTFGDVRHVHHPQNIGSSIPSTWVPCKQYSWTTWEEAGLPYWVWKELSTESLQLDLYLVRKVELWRINRAECSWWREGRGGGGCCSCLSVCLCALERQREEAEQTRGEMMNNRAREEEMFKSGQRRWLWVVSKHQRQERGHVTEAGCPSPKPVPWNTRILPQGWAGPTWTLNTIKGQGSRISSSSLHPCPCAGPVTWALTCWRACHNNTGTPMNEEKLGKLPGSHEGVQ